MKHASTAVRRAVITATATTVAMGGALVGAAATSSAAAADPPEISVASDIMRTEGNTSARTYYLRFVRTGDLSKSSSAKVTITDGSATAGSDYTTAHDVTTIPFTAGKASATVAVRVLGDRVGEADETFDFTLSDPFRATLGDDAGTFTITNDDATGPATFSVDDPVITEGDSATSQLVFTVTRSGSTEDAVSVDAGTLSGTATPPSDYYTKSPFTLDFAAGRTTRIVKVAIRGDLVAEPEETFSLELSDPVGATITDASGVATIVDND